MCVLYEDWAFEMSENEGNPKNLLKNSKGMLKDSFSICYELSTKDIWWNMSGNLNDDKRFSLSLSLSFHSFSSCIFLSYDSFYPNKFLEIPKRLLKDSLGILLNVQEIINGRRYSWDGSYGLGRLFNLACIIIHKCLSRLYISNGALLFHRPFENC